MTPEPAPGQLVTVRNRLWTVADVARGAVADGDAHRVTARPQHLVSLVSVEDDARDESLRVVWELEPGVVVHEREALPGPEQGFDEPGQLDAFLDAVRWGAIASADRSALQAPFRSGVTIEDYQLDPVARALSMPRVNLLIADDVGLGKTVEAGLVMQELLLRHRARKMLIVCPASLTVQWRDEMREKFGLDFRIVDSELLRALRREQGLYVNPWAHYPRLITSIDWLKRDRPMRLLRDFLKSGPAYPRPIDLLVVDEVHACAPSGTGRYAVDTLRTKAIKELAPYCEHRLFLSATPHNGYLESFTALLELLDERRFARGVRPTEEQLRRVMVRRLKSELPPRWDGSPRFPERKLLPLEVELAGDEREAHGLLREYAASRLARAADPRQRAAADFVTTLLKKRLLSSPAAFHRTLLTHLDTVSGRAPALGAAPPPDVLRRYAERLDETGERDEEYDEVEFEALAAANRAAQPLTPAERELLDRLIAWADQARGRADAKFRCFLTWLDGVVRPGGRWSDARVIVFTEYRDTQRWLRERLVSAGYPAERIALLYGGMDAADRERVKNEFQGDPALAPVRVLVATDAASEGISLQRHCHRLLHWEIPWNPNRLEQRNGRVDRHGQRAREVLVYHFVPAGYREKIADGSLEGDLFFLHQAAQKVEQIREDLGSVGPVIADQVVEAMLGRRSQLVETDAELRRRQVSRLKFERDLARRLEELTAQLTGSRDALNLSPATLERVVRTGLRLAHRKDLLPADPPAGFTGACFRLPELPGAWAEARAAGLRHPLTGEERPVTFDADAYHRHHRDDVVLLHLGSRLVQMCLRLLRAELWAGGATQARLRRVTARVVPGDSLRTPAVVAYGRMVVTGADGTRLHEELVTAGGFVEGGRLARADAEELARFLAGAGDRQPGEETRARLAELWPTLGPSLERQLRTEVDKRFRRLAKELDKRCAEEVAAVGEVLAELERSIRDALDDTEHWEQISLFETQSAEREQLRADRAALEERLAQLPEIRDREQDALRRRYADPVPRLFPAAVAFLVPSALA
ncbi:hypothetical protein TH66_05995 [Carbonactinospora thermoautotrophica]|uniref:Helicase n=2 Tax=Carbonactinospora thermoautotrophica TaxID=1469144 RepID=A0A132N3T3_9ACTN|nr:DISARM system SNF2-like helicase DrmD [Carbonactinospora thermoautotrophica]KWX04744.1 hypothetical protein TH66_05995 [Carbonactinospora thermoautotrophica]